MSISANEYQALWRSSANEGVPYSEDFPEALLVLPEFLDGALGAGNASIIDLTFNITNPKECELIVNDNGKGLVSEKRMKDWSSKETGNNETENIYGHGSKKALTKFIPEFVNAKWTLSWRKQDKRGLSGALNILSSPFNGLDTKHIEDDENEDTCPIHGTCWNIKFDISVLGKYNKPAELMNALQEIIRSRYEPSKYQPYTINVKIINGATILQQKSTEWKSLKAHLDDEIQHGSVKKTHESSITVDKTTATYSFYEIVDDGRKYNIPGMPIYGRKNMTSSRVHLARNGRYIEAMAYSKFIGNVQHNAKNGKIGFVMFTGEELPTPCTTKVKFQEECPIFKKMTALIIKHIITPPAKISVTVKPVVVTTPPPTTAIVAATTLVVQKPVAALKQKQTLLPVASTPPPTTKSAVKKTVVHTPVAIKPVVSIATPPESSIIQEEPVIVPEKHDIHTLELLHKKYGSKLLVSLLDDFNKKQ
jgi:hypothetical protein